jgi:hypothetical protein
MQGKTTDIGARLDFDFRFSVSVVSNFELRISDFDSGTIGGLGAINNLEVILLSIRQVRI